MFAAARQKENLTAARHAEWQVDRAKRSATHISGLIVSWQVVGKGAARLPALDLAGLEKAAVSPWAAQINTLVEQAIALLEQ